MSLMLSVLKTFFLAGALVFFTAVFSPASANPKEECLSGKYHRTTPMSEDNGYKECQPWKSLTCCTAAFTADLAQNQTRNLYNHSWHRCSKLSTACERHWINQECFYQCSPYVSKWKDKGIQGAVNRVPICASVCDRWYEACIDDEICVENVITGYNFTEHGENFCPANKPCVTYRRMYGSGKVLCEKMWGNSYQYVEENRDSSNCMVMWFNGKNPNQFVNPKQSSSSSNMIFSPGSSKLGCAMTILYCFWSLTSLLPGYIDNTKLAQIKF